MIYCDNLFQSFNAFNRWLLLFYWQNIYVSSHLGKETKWGLYRRVGGKKHSSIAMNSFSLSCLSRRRLDRRVEESWPLICHAVTLVCCFQNASHAAHCGWQKCRYCCQSQVFLSPFVKLRIKYSSLPAEHNPTPAFINSAWSQKDLCQVWEVSNTHELQIAL